MTLLVIGGAVLLAWIVKPAFDVLTDLLGAAGSLFRMVRRR